MSTFVRKSEKHPGIIMKSKNNPEYGAIMLIEERDSFSGGFANGKRKRVGLLKGKVENLEKLNWKEGQIVPFKIVYKESLEEFYPGQEPKKYPDTNSDGTPNERAGKLVTCMGAPIYVNKLAVENTDPMQDELLAIDREPVQAKDASTKGAEIASKTETFSTSK
jgi:hypothetical protein